MIPHCIAYSGVDIHRLHFYFGENHSPAFLCYNRRMFLFPCHIYAFGTTETRSKRGVAAILTTFALNTGTVKQEPRILQRPTYNHRASSMESFKGDCTISPDTMLPLFFPEGPILRFNPRGWLHNFATAGRVPILLFGENNLQSFSHAR